MTTPQTTTQRQNGYLSEPDAEGVQSIELPELSEVEKQELEAAGEYVAVPVGDLEVRVKPQRDWRMSDLRALNNGDFDGFAESLVHPDDIDAFLEQDLTLGEFREFTDEAARRAGDSLGKSSGRSRSSKPTRRR